jgi:hypothetical protein
VVDPAPVALGHEEALKRRPRATTNVAAEAKAKAIADVALAHAGAVMASVGVVASGAWTTEAPRDEEEQAHPRPDRCHCERHAVRVFVRKNGWW